MELVLGSLGWGVLVVVVGWLTAANEWEGGMRGRMGEGGRTVKEGIRRHTLLSCTWNSEIQYFCMTSFECLYRLPFSNFSRPVFLLSSPWALAYLAGKRRSRHLDASARSPIDTDRRFVRHGSHTHTRTHAHTHTTKLHSRFAGEDSPLLETFSTPTPTPLQRLRKLATGSRTIPI